MSRVGGFIKSRYRLALVASELYYWVYRAFGLCHEIGCFKRKHVVLSNYFGSIRPVPVCKEHKRHWDHYCEYGFLSPPDDYNEDGYAFVDEGLYDEDSDGLIIPDEGYPFELFKDDEEEELPNDTVYN